MLADALEQARMSGRRYEESLAQARPALRKANGVYYTPAAIVDHVVQHTLGPALRATSRPITVLDPACGCGAFLVAARQYLLDWSRQHVPRRRRSFLEGIYGVDQDHTAIKTARAALGSGNGDVVPRANIKHRNSLFSDWSGDFPEIMNGGGFDVVIGNPPWGQKDIIKDEELKRQLRQLYPSSAGI